MIFYKKMRPPVTILVSVKNKEGTIRKCIDSLLKVDYPEKKILIIDNFSTDKTPEILEDFRNKIRVYRKSGGLSEIFNWALEKVTTKYVAFTDGDCIVDKIWLKELVPPLLHQKEITATAGYCGTPKDASFLQKLIGLELENRFKRFPKYIQRAPTMNFCVHTEIARNVRFDEKFIYQAFEVDFCYRLQKYGKILYVPRAKVWHYHRSTLKNFFIQQKNQAKWGLKLLTKYGLRALGDNITTFGMTLQIPLLLGILFFLPFLLVSNFFFYPIFLFFLVLIFIYFKTLFEINPPLSYVFPFLGLFLLRTLAWVIGMIEGLISFYLKFPKLKAKILSILKYQSK